MWFIRAGRDGIWLDRFLETGVAGLGFHAVQDLAIDADRDQIREAFSRAYPEASEGTLSSWTGQAHRFLHEVAIGDRVATADMKGRRYIVGTVQSQPRLESAPAGMKESGTLRVRDVAWDRHLSVDALPRSVRNSLGGALSIFRVPDPAREAIEQLAGPLGETLPELPPPDVPDLAVPPPMAARAREALQAYLESNWPGQPKIPPRDEVERQRRAFLARFAPEALAAMSEREWLDQIPLGVASRDSMDFWLEFKSDDEFNTRLFGGIGGGSAAKFGVWLERKSGRWRIASAAQKIRNGTESEAIEALRVRVSEARAAVQVVQSYVGVPIHEIDCLEVQRRVEEAAPTSASKAWLHKYLSLACPELISWSATEGFSRAQLYRVGVPAPEGLGLYAMDVLLLQFWSLMEPLGQEPPDVRWRVTAGHNPRGHRLLWEADAEQRRRMIEGGYIGIGPGSTGDLAKALELGKKTDIKAFVKTALMQGEGKAPGRLQNELADLLGGFKDGAIVALCADKETVVAVGRVSGDYAFAPGEDVPHRKPVEWFHTTRFDLPGPAWRGKRRTRALQHDHPAVAEVEASIVASGRFPWPGFERFALLAPAAGAGGDSTGHDRRKEQQVKPIAEKSSPGGLPPLEEPLAGLRDALARKGQLILYGPPGTGKTYQAKRLALEVIARENFGKLPAELGPHAQAVEGSDTQVGHLSFATFHPMYAYEDFVEGYRPDGRGSFSVRPGIFRRIAEAAHHARDKRFVLVIDEINRGNIPKIFGELITLLETDKRDVLSVRLPLSGVQFSVPGNLWIIGTMNTADRSIALLDTALRRRFALRELMPNLRILKGSTVEGLSLADWLRSLNGRIVEALGHDGRNLQIGHAYLMHGGTGVASVQRLRDIVRDDIWPLLQEYCYEDPQMLTAILCQGGQGIYDPEGRDLRHELFEAGRELDFVEALSCLLVGVSAGGLDDEGGEDLEDQAGDEETDEEDDAEEDGDGDDQT